MMGAAQNGIRGWRGILAAGALLALAAHSAAAEAVTVQDASGREVRVDDASRIVSIGGAVTEILYALGLDEKIVAVDITDPRSARIAGWGTNRDYSGDAEAGTAWYLGPEGIHFIPAAQSQNGQPLLLVGNEVSGTTTVWQVETAR